VQYVVMLQNDLRRKPATHCFGHHLVSLLFWLACVTLGAHWSL